MDEINQNSNHCEHPNIERVKIGPKDSDVCYVCSRCGREFAVEQKVTEELGWSSIVGGSSHTMWETAYQNFKRRLINEGLIEQ